VRCEPTLKTADNVDVELFYYLLQRILELVILEFSGNGFQESGEEKIQFSTSSSVIVTVTMG
jgi:hypothetical protein